MRSWTSLLIPFSITRIQFWERIFLFTYLALSWTNIYLFGVILPKLVSDSFLFMIVICFIHPPIFSKIIKLKIYLVAFILMYELLHRWESTLSSTSSPSQIVSGMD
jgi:hypothetical protein